MVVVVDRRCREAAKLRCFDSTTDGRDTAPRHGPSYHHGDACRSIAPHRICAEQRPRSLARSLSLTHTHCLFLSFFLLRTHALLPSLAYSTLLPPRPLPPRPPRATNLRNAHALYFSTSLLAPLILPSHPPLSKRTSTRFAQVTPLCFRVLPSTKDSTRLSHSTSTRASPTLTHSPIHSFIHPLTHHPLTHSLTDPSIHPSKSSIPPSLLPTHPPTPTPS